MNNWNIAALLVALTIYVILVAGILVQTRRASEMEKLAEEWRVVGRSQGEVISLQRKVIEGLDKRLSPMTKVPDLTWFEQRNTNWMTNRNITHPTKFPPLIDIYPSLPLPPLSDKLEGERLDYFKNAAAKMRMVINTNLSAWAPFPTNKLLLITNVSAGVYEFMDLQAFIKSVMEKP